MIDYSKWNEFLPKSTLKLWLAVFVVASRRALKKVFYSVSNYPNNINKRGLNKRVLNSGQYKCIKQFFFYCYSFQLCKKKYRFFFIRFIIKFMQFDIIKIKFRSIFTYNKLIFNSNVKMQCNISIPFLLIRKDFDIYIKR